MCGGFSVAGNGSSRARVCAFLFTLVCRLVGECLSERRIEGRRTEFVCLLATGFVALWAVASVLFSRTGTVVADNPWNGRLYDRRHSHKRHAGEEEEQIFLLIVHYAAPVSLILHCTA